MTTHFTTPLYAVSIPEEFSTILDSYDDIRNNPIVFTDLAQLAKLIPLNDVFHFIYDQTENPIFSQFINRYGLKSILQMNTNIQWMSSVASQYDTYLLDRKTMEKNNTKDSKDKNNRVIGFDTIHELYYNVKQIGKNDIVLGFFAYDENISLKDGKTELNETLFKDKLFNVVYDYLGYDALRKHDINKYLLRIGY